MKGGFLREMARMVFRAAYEEGLEKGARLVSADLLETRCQQLADETERAEFLLRKLGKAEKERDEALAELEAAKAELDKARRNEARMSNLRDDTLVHCRKELDKLYEWQARAEKAEAALASQPAAYPWSDEAVERAARTHLEHRVFSGAWDMLKAETKEVFLARMRAATGTLAPPPQDAPVRFDARSAAIAFANGDHEHAEEQAAPVPPVGVGDVWGDAVRVDSTHGSHRVMLGEVMVEAYGGPDHADRAADRIRRGLASLPPLRAVLVGGVTEEMVRAYIDAMPVSGDGVRDGLTAALAVAPIRVLGPGERVVRVRVCKAGEVSYPDNGVVIWKCSVSGWWFPNRAEDMRSEASDTLYILAADLDAAAAGLGEGGAHGE